MWKNYPNILSSQTADIDMDIITDTMIRWRLIPSFIHYNMVIIHIISAEESQVKCWGGDEYN